MKLGSFLDRFKKEPGPGESKPAARPAAMAPGGAAAPPAGPAASGPAAPSAPTVEDAYAKLRAIREVLGKQDEFIQVPFQALFKRLPPELQGEGWQAAHLPAGTFDLEKNGLLGQLKKGRVCYPLSTFLPVLPPGLVRNQPDATVDLDLPTVVAAIPPDVLTGAAQPSKALEEVADMPDYFAPKEGMLPEEATTETAAAVPPAPVPVAEEVAAPPVPPVPAPVEAAPVAATPVEAVPAVPPPAPAPVEAAPVAATPVEAVPAVPPPAPVPAPVAPEAVVAPVAPVPAPVEAEAVPVPSAEEVAPAAALAATAAVLPTVAAAAAPVVEPPLAPAAPVPAAEPVAATAAEEPVAPPRVLPVGWDGVEHTLDSAVRGLDLNTAGEEELLSLPGVGPVRARAILAFRAQRGSFRNVYELLQVPGVGPQLFRQMTGLSPTTGRSRREQLNDLLGLESGAHPSLGQVAEAIVRLTEAIGCVLTNSDGIPLGRTASVAEQAMSYAALTVQLFRRSSNALAQLAGSRVDCIVMPNSDPALTLYAVNDVYLVVAFHKPVQAQRASRKLLRLAYELGWFLGRRAVVRAWGESPE